MNTKDALRNKALEERIGQRIVADGGVALRLKCVGYAESSAHYADAVLVSATSLTLSIDAVADSTVGATGVLAFATYTTLGTLVDAINLSANWQAEIVAGLRSDTVSGSELLARTTSTFRMHTNVELNWDSSDNGVYGISFLLESNLPFESTAKQSPQRVVGLTRILFLVDTSDSGTAPVVCYEVGRDRASALKTLGTWVAADNTEKDTGESEEPLFEVPAGNSILVRVTDASWQDALAYLQVHGVRRG